MTAPMIRGYSVKQTAGFIESHFEPAVRDRLMASLTPELREELATLKPAQWYPREYSAVLLRAIASARTDEKQVAELLAACGEYISNEATNTFLKLVMKILTPTMFAKKVPDFWTRDHSAGAFVVDTTDVDKKRIAMRLTDVGGYDHVTAVAVGFLSYAMRTIGFEKVKVVQSGWSLAQPAPNEVSYEITW